MGLIRAVVGSVAGTLKDQWKEVISCEDMSNDVLMVEKTTPNGVISNGSTVVVAPGQCAVIFDTGKIIDATAEEGVYTFDTSATPSFFAGQFGDVFKEMWQRFTYGGGSAKHQAVFFFNLKEIMDNKFGTPAPVPYKDWGHPLMNARTNSYMPMRVDVKCFGKYTFKIDDVALFMNQVAGTAKIYKKDMLIEQMRSEVIGAFSNIMNSLGSDEHKIEVLELPNRTDEIKAIMDQEVFDEPIRKRGIKLVSFVVESLTLTEESNQKIDNYEMGGDAYQMQGSLAGAYANAVQDAANNSNGAANGFMGVGMMNMAGGNAFGNMGVGGNVPPPMQPNANQASQVTQASGTAVVSNGATNTCTWKCPNCNIDVTGKFCSECGAAKPGKHKCKKCGYEMDEKKKFCPECGAPTEE